MARLYADENFPFPVVVALRQLGHDVLTTPEAGNAGQAILDDEVLAFAIADNRAVLTVNRRHFMRLHRADSAHAGIVICTTDADFVGQAQRVHAVLVANPALNGLLLRVYRPDV